MKRVIKKINPELLEFMRHGKSLMREIEKENEIIKLSTKDLADYTHKRLYFILIVFGVFSILLGKTTEVILGLKYFEKDFSIIYFILPVISVGLLLYLMFLTILYANNAGRILGWLGTGKDINEDFKREINQYKVILTLVKIFLVILFFIAVSILAKENAMFYKFTIYALFPFILCFSMVGLKKLKLYGLFGLAGLMGYFIDLSVVYYLVLITLFMLKYNENVFQRILGNIFKLIELSPNLPNHIIYPLLLSFLSALPLLHFIAALSTSVIIEGPNSPESTTVVFKVEGKYIPEIKQIEINGREVSDRDIRYVYSKSHLNIDSNIVSSIIPLVNKNDQPNYSGEINIGSYKQNGLNRIKIEYVIPSFRPVTAEVEHLFQQK
ncbi:hypothetical protein [Brevibacillus choshinensis]|uniref:hypothetical protein n=1 Tax=Brevibacillus choshinensis TaxID=54911 RepID=UPI002E1A6F72|nr:hypothetical protein [Brevibacillus choshinensis]